MTGFPYASSSMVIPIDMPSLDHGAMKEFGISFSLFMPLDSGLLPLESFFLGIPFLQLMLGMGLLHF